MFVDIITGVIVIALGIPAAWAVRRLYHKCFVEYDRSAIIRLDIESECPNNFSNLPIIIGPMPYSDFHHDVVPDLDPRLVVGFLVGAPQKIDKPLHAGIEAEEWHEPGYYAYAIIRWDRVSEFEMFARRGYSIAKTQLRDSKGNLVQAAESRVLSVKTAAIEGQCVVSITTGPLAPFRYQPYKRAGFTANDLQQRQLSLLCHGLLFVLKFAPEWVKFKTQESTKGGHYV